MTVIVKLLLTESQYDDNRVPLIKLFRQSVDCSLRQAKGFLDATAASGGRVARMNDDQALRLQAALYKGRLGVVLIVVDYIVIGS